MKYYRVKPGNDNRKRYKRNSLGLREPAGILIGGELYTATEFKRLANDPSQFEEVEINKNNTYKFFGARFAM